MDLNLNLGDGYGYGYGYSEIGLIRLDRQDRYNYQDYQDHLSAHDRVMDARGNRVQRWGEAARSRQGGNNEVIFSGLPRPS